MLEALQLCGGMLEGARTVLLVAVGAAESHQDLTEPVASSD